MNECSLLSYVYMDLGAYYDICIASVVMILCY